jgi:predicted GNAT family acetyltransferase
VKVSRFEDPATFLDEAAPLLLDDEPRHNLILGLAGTLRDDPSVYTEYELWLVDDEGKAVAAALRTSPYNLVLARPRNPAALDALVAAIDDDLPGVVGALPEVETFSTAWSAKRGVKARRRMGQGVFALERVAPVSGVPGGMRQAGENDRPLLLEWLNAFGVEALNDDEPDDERLARVIDHRLSSADAGLVFWEHDGPVSMAGFGGRTPNGIRVGPVYTPPNLRGRGYASALVAELSASLLESGRRFCFLYTDLSNPTSNRIYERIGYERVCDSAEIVFEPA